MLKVIFLEFLWTKKDIRWSKREIDGGPVRLPMVRGGIGRYLNPLTFRFKQKIMHSAK